MSETSQGDQQYFAKADARKGSSPDTKQEKLVSSPEQKQTIEAFQNAQKAAEQQVTQAHHRAGEQLKQLKGKELVAIGLKKIGIGAGLGWVTENIGTRVGALAGAGAGAVGGGLAGSFSKDVGAGDGAVLGGAAGLVPGMLIGKGAGFESTGLVYDKLFMKNRPQQEKLAWYDWAIGQVGLFLPRYSVLRIGDRFHLRFINPVTVSGFRNIGEGLWKMAKGQ